MDHPDDIPWYRIDENNCFHPVNPAAKDIDEEIEIDESLVMVDMPPIINDIVMISKSEGVDIIPPFDNIRPGEYDDLSYHYMEQPINHPIDINDETYDELNYASIGSDTRNGQDYPECSGGSSPDERDDSDDEILLQLAQKCFYCGLYLMGGQETAVYNGKQKRYTDWVVHQSCHLIF